MRAWLLISAVLLLAAGGALGFLGGRWQGEPERGAISEFDVADSWQRRLISSEDVWRELGISPQQRSELEDLLRAHHGTVQALRGRIQSEFEHVRNQVLGVLTEEQRVRLEGIEKRYVDVKVEARVLRELAMIRREVGIEPPQEAAVFQIVFDAHKARHEFFNRCRGGSAGEKVSREQVRQFMEETRAHQEERLGKLLGEEWLEKYREVGRKYQPPSWGRRKRPKDRDGRPPSSRAERGEAGRGDAEPTP